MLWYVIASPDPRLTVLLCPPARRARPCSASATSRNHTLADDYCVCTAALRSGTGTQSSEARSAAWMMRKQAFNFVLWASLALFLTKLLLANLFSSSLLP